MSRVGSIDQLGDCGRAHSLGQEDALALLRALLSAHAHPGFIPAVLRSRGSQKDEPDTCEESPSRPHTTLDSHGVPRVMRGTSSHFESPPSLFCSVLNMVASIPASRKFSLLNLS